MPWFEVIAPVYDYVPRNNHGRMVSYPHGGPYFGTEACVQRGESVGKIKRVPQPKEFRVTKKGEVVRRARSD